jgi:hypothetical protein
MELTLEHATIEDQEEVPPEGGPRLCACGCGGPLRNGAKRAYLRGHKALAEAEGGQVDRDPEPGEESHRRVYRATTKIKTEMRETIEAYMAMMCAAWSMKDPLCANAVIDIIPQTAEKLVPILARNQIFVRYFQTSNGFRDGMDLFLTLLPALQVIAAHHLFHTIGTETQMQNGEVPNYNEYVA